MEQKWHPRMPTRPPMKSLKDDSEEWQRWLHELYISIVELYRLVDELASKKEGGDDEQR